MQNPVPARIAAVLFMAFAVWAVPAMASACKCKPVASMKRATEDSALVFEGRALASSEDTGAASRTTEFEVLRTFKGENCTRVEVVTRLHSSACGKKYELGETYLIYAQERDGALRDGACYRSGLSADLGQDLAKLGEGLVPSCEAEPVKTAPDTDPDGSEETPAPLADVDTRPTSPTEPTYAEPRQPDPPPVPTMEHGCAATIHGDRPSPASLGALLLLLLVPVSRGPAGR